MGEIKEYNSPTEGFQVSDRGTESAVTAGRRIQAAYTVAGDTQTAEGRRLGGAITTAGETAVKFAEHQEISHGAAAEAAMTARLTQQWNETAKTADPNDPTVAAKFREDVLEPQLEKYRGAFMTEGGQRFAEAKVGALRNHMFQKTASDMSSLASVAAKTNFDQIINQNSNTAMTDPSSVPHLLSGTDASVGEIVSSSPTLDGVTAAKVRIELAQKAKESIVKAGAIGAIQQSGNPEAEAERWGKKYPEYISGADLKTLGANARQQIRAARQDQAYSEKLNEKAVEDKSEATETQYLQRLYSDDAKEKSQVSSKAIVNDPGLTRVAKERMLNIVKRELEPETAAQESNRNYLDVLGGIRSGKITDTGPIFDARIQGKLNRADFNQAVKDFNDYKSPQGEALGNDRTEFFKRYSATIDGAMDFGGHSALGSQKIYDAEKDARRQETLLRQKGLDPHLVYDPRSEYFFGTPANMSKYHVSLQDGMNFEKKVKGGDKPFAPPPTWQFSPSRKKYRDPASGTLYDENGKPVQ